MPKRVRGEETVPTVPNNSTIDLDQLASSIAPSVYGHVEAKKGLLLMMLGAVPKKSRSGAWQSRGNIHVCLLGDPSTAKSTLLKWVESALPQAVYVSGASASIPGLTAAVGSDDTRTLSPGALVMASGSICCIDSFEQIGDAGKHAIGEVMDHQAIAINKAGVHTKLKAETSVLVACLPREQGYDNHRPLRANVEMPESVTQCFDLIHVLRDGCGSEDEEVASHIIAEAGGTSKLNAPCMPLAELRRYLSLARSLQPKISDEASDHLSNCYRRLRETGLASPRRLESLIRLSEAVARGYLKDTVTTGHVDEAFKLMNTTPGSTEKELGAGNAKRICHMGA